MNTKRGADLINGQRRRVDWIDVAKGITMILVFYGHLPGSGDNPWFPDLMASREIVYYFHMPLFFVLSGLTMHLDGDFRTFVWKRFRRLIVPYYVFSLYALGKIVLKILSPSTFAGFHSKDMSGPWQEVGNIFLGNSFGLWFFWALFWGDIVMFLLHKLPSRNWTILASIVGLTLWCIVSTHPIALPFQLAATAEAVGFSAIGYLTSTRLMGELNRVSGRMPAAASAVAFTLLVMVKMLLPGTTIIQFLLTVLLAITGSFMVMFISVLLPAFSWLTYIGRNTIVFYGLNGLSLAMAKALFFHIVPTKLVTSTIWPQLASGAVVIVIACIICWIASQIINKWCPWAIGMKRLN